jgi:hypothetical protein
MFDNSAIALSAESQPSKALNITLRILQEPAAQCFL